MQLKFNEILDVNLLDKVLKDFYDIIKVPISIVDINGEVIVQAGWTKMCSNVPCCCDEFQKLCLNEYWKSNLNCVQTIQEISCLNGLRMYRIPVYIKETVMANIFLCNSSSDIEPLLNFTESFTKMVSEILENSYKNKKVENNLEKNYKELKTSYDQLVTANNNLRFHIWELQQRINTQESIQSYQIEDAERKYLMDTVTALGSMVEKRDIYTAKHQKKVAYLACRIAIKLKLEKNRLEGLYVAAMLHDIGKIGIPTEILSKPDKLSEMEYDMVKTHAKIAYDILKEIHFPWPVADIVLQHHERLDGSGYPGNLTGDEILWEAKILSVADVVEAITAHRSYKPALGMDYALKEIRKYSGIYYEPEIVKACISVCTEGLSNTILLLDNGT